MTDIVFMDTETLGLDPNAPIWEFAAVRRDETGAVVAEIEIQIHHDPAGWLDDFPEEFAADYHGRYDETAAWCESNAASLIHSVTNGAHIIGAVPSFDTERLGKLLRRNGLQPAWHYHLIDVENVVVGYLAGVSAANGVNIVPAPPWKSDELSAAVGVRPDDYARHSAMGDVRWTIAQWDAVIR